MRQETRVSRALFFDLLEKAGIAVIDEGIGDLYLEFPCGATFAIEALLDLDDSLVLDITELGDKDQ